MQLLSETECPSKEHDGRTDTDSFSNEWVVHLEGGANVADLIALRLGYVNIGEVCTEPRKKICTCFRGAW